MGPIGSLAGQMMARISRDKNFRQELLDNPKQVLERVPGRKLTKAEFEAALGELKKHGIHPSRPARHVRNVERFETASG